MKLQKIAAAAQGVTAAGETFVSNFSTHKRQKSLKNRVGLFFLQGFVLALFLTFGGTSAHGQNCDTLDVAAVGFEIAAPNVTLGPGEAATLTIELGSSSNPINDAVEFDITLSLSNKAAFPSNPQFSFDSSWFIMGSDWDTLQEPNQSNHTLRLRGVRSTGASGDGTIFMVSIESAENDVEASELISAGGGIIIVDDIGFKAAPDLGPKPEQEVLCYPNPASQHLNFRWQGEAPVEIRLCDLQGRQVAKEIPHANSFADLDVGHLPRGLFLACFKFKDREVTRKVLLD